MKWIVELEGGEAFPHNAAAACRLAASGKLVPGLGDVFQRLEVALAAARTVACGMVGTLQDPDGHDYNWRCEQPGTVEVDGVLMCEGCAGRLTESAPGQDGHGGHAR